ncbi:redox family protein [Candidatus Gastranaerophilus sp. (ex Termes propinquus)]|nr:redox family protein [Candidatus Gastranaerophilus sp. (ex Termes propinquus)]
MQILKDSFAEKAVENYKQGFSCSESIVKMAADLGLVHKDLINTATAFSGGMSSGCLCGAIAGAQMVIGSLHGRDKTGLAREKSKQFVEEFCAHHKVTCCRALIKNLEFSSPERKERCTGLVEDCADILKKLI